ncbi:MAG: DUF748 domain-containing protein [Burkholderiaceae bacterium]|nr:MAG: DUF748 domain-containing protein [Burkholderiaceae bacterium]
MFKHATLIKRLTIALAALYVVYLLFGWLALPRILQTQAEKYIAEKTGYKLTLDRPEFNPLALDLKLANLRLTDPDGKPLLAFNKLDVNLSISSLFRRTLAFDAIRLDGPEATIILLHDGDLNWLAFTDALRGKGQQPDKEERQQKPNASSLPRVDIESFVLASGRINFSDEKAGFETNVQPLDWNLTNVSTLRDDEGRYKISVRTADGASVQWHGESILNPLSIVGSLSVEDLDLASLDPYFKRAMPNLSPAGKAALATDYRVTYSAGHFNLMFDRTVAKVVDLRLDTGYEVGTGLAIKNIAAENGHFDLAAKKLVFDKITLSDSEISRSHASKTPVKFLQLDALTIEDTQVDLAARNATVGSLALKKGQVSAVRTANGHIDVVEAMLTTMRSIAVTKADAQPVAAPWHYQLKKFALEDFSAGFKDETVAPAANFAFDNIAMTIEGMSDNLTAALPIHASFHAHEGGNFETDGQVVPSGPTADVKFKLLDLALKPAQPYLAAVAKLSLGGGKLNSDGRASYGKRGVDLKGGFTLNDLRLVETDSNDVFLAWKSLASRSLELTSTRLGIGDMSLDGLDTKLIINKDKSVNLTHILRKPEAAEKDVTPAATTSRQKTPAFVFDIDRLRIKSGAMDFADYSLALPFGTRIHDLHGAVNGLSSRPGAPGQIELDGQVDEYGLARAVGQIDLLNPAGFTDIKVVFRNVEMTRLTPYSATFAGRKINSGKLSLDLEYKINKRQLTGTNQIIMDQLTLGERVESPQAKDLPLDFAIAVLQDSDGRIELGLPVSGSLDDPQFSYGAIVWKAIVNVIGKIATAPFRALASLFGSNEKFETVSFEVGDARLTPPEQEKLMKLANALNKRPRLFLTVHGVYAEADRVALQDRQLRQAVAEGAGQSVVDGEDPGPLSTHAPKVQAALESLYADRFGSGQLAALKDGFRKANPGQLEEGVAGKVMSRLSSLFREKRTLSDEEVSRLKGGDFHAILFQQLREKETVTDTQLQALATLRGENILRTLKTAGELADRLALAAPEKVDSDGRNVALKLELGAVAKPTANAAPAAEGVQGR